jgi:hypothetical protein
MKFLFFGEGVMQINDQLKDKLETRLIERFEVSFI